MSEKVKTHVGFIPIHAVPAKATMSGSRLCCKVCRDLTASSCSTFNKKTLSTCFDYLFRIGGYDKALILLQTVGLQ